MPTMEAQRRQPDPVPAPRVDWEAFYRSYRKPGYLPGFEIVNKLGGGMFGLQTVQNTRLNFTVNGVATGLAAGSYQVGLCGSSTSANWTNNEWGYTTALVTN